MLGHSGQKGCRERQWCRSSVPSPKANQGSSSIRNMACCQSGNSSKRRWLRGLGRNWGGGGVWGFLGGAPCVGMRGSQPTSLVTLNQSLPSFHLGGRRGWCASLRSFVCRHWSRHRLSDYTLCLLTPGDWTCHGKQSSLKSSNCLKRKSLLCELACFTASQTSAGSHENDSQPPFASLLAYLLTKCHREKGLQTGCSSTTAQAGVGSGQHCWWWWCWWWCYCEWCHRSRFSSRGHSTWFAYSIFRDVCCSGPVDLLVHRLK